MKTLVVLVLSCSVVGCAASNRQGPGPDVERVCVAHSRGGCARYDFKYPEDCQTPLEKMSEDSARAEAYRRGDPFVPQSYPGESTSQHLVRIGEEQRRADAYRKGESYTPSARPGESSSHWLKRSTQESGGSSPFGGSSFGRGR